MSDDAEVLIRRYQLAAVEHYLSAREVESSGRRAAVRVTNRHADELREIAATIGRMGSAAIESFAALLDERRHAVRNWAAFHILEVMNAPPDVVERAFAVLQEVASGDSINALGTRIRLDELRRRYHR
jgi:hypothetical protein